MKLRNLSPFASIENLFIFCGMLIASMAFGFIYLYNKGATESRTAYIRAHQCVVGETVNGAVTGYRCDLPQVVTLSTAKLEDLAFKESTQQPESQWKSYQASHSCQPAEQTAVSGQVTVYRCNLDGHNQYLNTNDLWARFTHERVASNSIH